MDNQLEKFIRDNAEAFDTRMPDPAVLSRIREQMEGGAGKKERTVVVPIRIVRLAAACLVLLAGAAIFWIGRETKTVEPVTVGLAPAAAKTDTGTPSTETTGSLAAVTDQAAAVAAHETASPLTPEPSYRQVIFAGLQNMDAPSQRMIAAAQALKLGTIDRDIIDALAKTMNSDPNTNVRLAALEALGKFKREDYVKKKLLESLQKQSDPMVQIALIDVLTVMRERKILDQLDKIVNDTKTIDAVKDHAYSSMFTLRS